MHVLIIEDEFLIALYLQSLVEEVGATSTAVADSEETAIAAAGAQPPDFIISDVTLGIGRGPSAVRALQAAIGPLPVIYVTATPMMCGDLGPTERVLAKPLDENAFVETFKQLHKLHGRDGRIII